MSGEKTRRAHLSEEGICRFSRESSFRYNSPMKKRWMVTLIVAGGMPWLGKAEAEVTIPYLDLNDDRYRQVLVDHEPGQYLGHPTTCLLDDGKTILTVYPKGHGKGGTVYKRSTDGGLTWSERLPTPESWATSREVPTLHRMTDAEGKKRIVMFSGLYPVRMAVTEDDGATWSELAPVGDWGGIVTMGCHFEVKGSPGVYRVLFHDDQYVGVWTGGGHGGQMFGTIVPLEEKVDFKYRSLFGESASAALVSTRASQPELDVLAHTDG